jgi:ectoine hydroxylase-related dioxygenase (phytanoyl-CoA dioxygenase family)
MDTPNTVTMWMPLVDVTIDMGALTFASGSQKYGDLGKWHISDATHEYFDNVVKEHGFPVVNHAMRAGDATFHSGWTLHSAPPNASDRSRQVITVVYYEDGTRAMPSMDNPHREWDFRTYMPGIEPGELAASPVNPVVYRR